MQQPEILRYLGKIRELESLQRGYEDPELLTTQEFADRARRGLRVTPIEYIRQYEAYCKGFCLHQSGQVNEAVVHYSEALTKSGRYSNNGLRLAALEGIEQVIREKVELERKEDSLEPLPR